MTALERSSNLLHPQILRPREDAARRILDAALARCYRLPLLLAGFAADLTLQVNDQTWHGSAAVAAPEAVRVTLPDVTARAWVRRTLHTLAAPGWDMFGSARSARAVLAHDATPHPRGALIRQGRDTVQAHYRVLGDTLTEYFRNTAPETTTTQIVARHHLPDGRWLPHVSTTSYAKQGSRRLVRSDTITDCYIVVEDVWLLAERQVLSVMSDTTTAYWLRLDNHRLLAHDDVEAPRVPARAKRQHRWL